jgi:uncharacterized membrane protein YGL010W
MRFSVPDPMRARLAEYDGYHQALGNELCHFFGIPSIIAGTAALLGLLPVAAIAGHRVTLAELVAGAILLFYVGSARWLGVVTGTILVVLVGAGRALPWTFGLALFVAGWVLQLVGHAVYEHRSPAFLRNLLHLLVGPAWLVERALARI